MPWSGTDTPKNLGHVCMIHTACVEHWRKTIYSLKKKARTYKKPSAILLIHSETKNARKTEFAPKSSWHVPAYEFQSFRAASRVLDTENDKYAAVLRNKLNKSSYGIFVHKENQKFDG